MGAVAYFIGEIKKYNDCFIIAPKRGYNLFSKRNSINGFYFSPDEKKAIIHYDDESSVMSLLKNPKPIIEAGKQKDLFELLRQYGKIEHKESYIPSIEFKEKRLFYLCMNCFNPNYIQIDSNDLGIILEYYHEIISNQKNEPIAFKVKTKDLAPKKDSLDNWVK
jgi:hypothetical protein